MLPSECDARICFGQDGVSGLDERTAGLKVRDQVAMDFEKLLERVLYLGSIVGRTPPCALVLAQHKTKHLTVAAQLKRNLI